MSGNKGGIACRGRHWTMAATFRKVGEFDTSQEKWSQYVDRLRHFFTANAIVNVEEKRLVFLAFIG